MMGQGARDEEEGLPDSKFPNTQYPIPNTLSPLVDLVVFLLQIGYS
jgi:hypothetical protein